MAYGGEEVVQRVGVGRVEGDAREIGHGEDDAEDDLRRRAGQHVSESAAQEEFPEHLHDLRGVIEEWVAWHGGVWCGMAMYGRIWWRGL